MPVYMGKEVSDDYLQGLISAYRDGQKTVGEVEDSDQIIIDRLSAKEVTSPRGPSAYDLGVADTQGGATSQSKKKR